MGGGERLGTGPTPTGSGILTGESVSIFRASTLQGASPVNAPHSTAPVTPSCNRLVQSWQYILLIDVHTLLPAGKLMHHNEDRVDVACVRACGG